MKIFTIYVLKHPITNEIKYVGQTIQKLHNRLRKHIRERSKCHKTNWIKSLKDLVPIIEKIDEAITKEDSDNLECFYIKKYKNLGYKLTNMTDGGDGSYGFTHTDETKNKLKTPKTKEHIEKLRIAGTIQWNNLSDEDKLNNQKNQNGRIDIIQKTLDGVFIKKWISIREIERVLGIYRAGISSCLKKKTKQSGGFIWEYDKN